MALVSNLLDGRRVLRGGGRHHDLRDLYAAIGAAPRGPAAGWRTALLAARPGCSPARSGLMPVEERVRTTNGGVPVRLMVSPLAVDPDTGWIPAAVGPAAVGGVGAAARTRRVRLPQPRRLFRPVLVEQRAPAQGRPRPRHQLTELGTTRFELRAPLGDAQTVVGGDGLVDQAGAHDPLPQFTVEENIPLAVVALDAARPSPTPG